MAEFASKLWSLHEGTEEIPVITLICLSGSARERGLTSGSAVAAFISLATVLTLIRQ